MTRRLLVRLIHVRRAEECSETQSSNNKGKGILLLNGLPVTERPLCSSNTKEHQCISIVSLTIRSRLLGRILTKYFARFSSKRLTTRALFIGFLAAMLHYVMHQYLKTQILLIVLLFKRPDSSGKISLNSL